MKRLRPPTFGTMLVQKHWQIFCSLVAWMLSAGAHRQRRPCPAQALQHQWLREQQVLSDAPLDSVVVTRIQKFAANSRFKKAAIGIMAKCLSPAELTGLQVRRWVPRPPALLFRNLCACRRRETVSGPGWRAAERRL